MSDIIADLESEVEQSRYWRGPNGFPCECDPSTGAVPCSVCYQRDILKRAIAEITALRQREEAADESGDSELNRLRKEVKKLRRSEKMLIKSLFLASCAGPKWISVKDRLPECPSPVIVCVPIAVAPLGLRVIGEFFKIEGSWSGFCSDEGREDTHVTHWQPMPPPPKGEK